MCVGGGGGGVSILLKDGELEIVEKIQQKPKLKKGTYFL